MRVPSSLSAAGCNKDSKAWNCSPIRKRAGAGSTFCRTTCRGGVGNGKLGCVSDFSLVSNVLCLIHLLVIIFDYNYIILYLPGTVSPYSGISDHKYLLQPQDTAFLPSFIKNRLDHHNTRSDARQELHHMPHQSEDLAEPHPLPVTMASSHPAQMLWRVSVSQGQQRAWG